MNLERRNCLPLEKLVKRVASLLALVISLSQAPGCKTVNQANKPPEKRVAALDNVETPCLDLGGMHENIKKVIVSIGFKNIVGILRLPNPSQAVTEINERNLIQALMNDRSTWICKKDSLSEASQVLVIPSEKEVYLIFIASAQQPTTNLSVPLGVIDLCSSSTCNRLECFLVTWLLKYGKDFVLEVDLVNYLIKHDLKNPEQVATLATNPYLARLLDQSLAQDLKEIAEEPAKSTPAKLIKVSRILSLLSRVESHITALRNLVGYNQSGQTYERQIQLMVALQIVTPLSGYPTSFREEILKNLQAIIEQARTNNYPESVITTLHLARQILELTSQK